MDSRAEIGLLCLVFAVQCLVCVCVCLFVCVCVCVLVCVCVSCLCDWLFCVVSMCGVLFCVAVLFVLFCFALCVQFAFGALVWRQ